jgi:lipoate-protein ligase A
MQLLDLTLPTPAENLACDEALLDAAEAGELTDEVLRFWESPTHFIVVGHANHIRKEVNDDVPVPVLRRCSGGGTVVQGPGCLNYALILRIPATGPLAHLTGTNTYIMDRMAEALNRALILSCGSGVPAASSSDESGCSGASVKRRAFPMPQQPAAHRAAATPHPEDTLTVSPHGSTDLALGERKFSGNAQRRKRHWLLFHGTFLLNFDLTLIGRLLKFPTRVPDYRQGRSHLDFVRNLPVTAAAVKAAVVAAWDVDGNLPVVPHARIAQLVASHYGRPEWNEKF